MKHKKLCRWLGVPLALLLFAAALPTAALTPSYPVTGTYLSSTYYDNLRNLPRTGDKAFDTLAIALSQLDYHEGNSTADFDGKNKSGYRNFTEYNHAFGQIGGTYGYAWCAAFVSWCLEEADAAGSAGGLFASCTLWVEQLQRIGRYSTRSSGYTPKAGDLIFFRSAGVSRASDHVGLVRYVKGGRVYTVEGNSSDRVALRDYKLSDTYIVGYGRPGYKSAYLLPHSALDCEDTVTGWYTVTNDFVNVRAGAKSTAAKRGSLYKGSMVRIIGIQNGWGSFYYKNELSYISLDYADFTAPLTYRVTYDATGGTGAPATVSYFSMSDAFVSTAAPAQEGFLFLHWQDAAGNVYTAGQHLPRGDVALHAVWEAVPVTEPSDESDPPLPEQGDGQELLSPPAADIPPNVVEKAEIAANYTAARIAAGITVGVLSAGLGALWYYRRKKEE